MYRHNDGDAAAAAGRGGGVAMRSSGMVYSGRVENNHSNSGRGGDRRFLNSTKNDRGTEPNIHPPYWNKSHPGMFYFDRANQNPTQAQVDEFFRQQPELNSHEIVNIFLRAVQWKKKKGIDVLGGDKLSFVTESIMHMMSKLDGRQLTQTAMATVNGLQVIASIDIQMSGQ